MAIEVNRRYLAKKNGRYRSLLTGDGGRVAVAAFIIGLGPMPH
jgi:hypothetical protein